MTKEELEKILADAMAPVKALQGSFEALQKDVTALKTSGGKIDAASVNALVKPHADNLRTVAAGMQSAGIGTHHSEGHVLVLNRMADRMEAEAMLGKMPHIYRDHDYFVNAAGAEHGKAVKELETKVEAFGKQITDLVGQVGTEISDMKAAAAKQLEAGGGGGPKRTTMPPHIAALLSKTGITVDAAQKMDIVALDAALDKAGIKRQDALKIKLALNHAGAFSEHGTAQ